MLFHGVQNIQTPPSGTTHHQLCYLHPHHFLGSLSTGAVHFEDFPEGLSGLLVPLGGRKTIKLKSMFNLRERHRAGEIRPVVSQCLQPSWKAQRRFE